MVVALLCLLRKGMVTCVAETVQLIRPVYAGQRVNGSTDDSPWRAGALCVDVVTGRLTNVCSSFFAPSQGAGCRLPLSGATVRSSPFVIDPLVKRFVKKELLKYT